MANRLLVAEALSLKFLAIEHFILARIQTSSPGLILLENNAFSFSALFLKTIN